jgi:hypothetical protein
MEDDYYYKFLKKGTISLTENMYSKLSRSSSTKDVCTLETNKTMLLYKDNVTLAVNLAICFHLKRKCINEKKRDIPSKDKRYKRVKH